MIGGGSYRWEPGEFTDDTQMAIIQAESILERGVVDGADLFERFQTWSDTAADVGNQTSAVLSSGLPWDMAAADYFERLPRKAAGNGSLMRATPTAVHYASRSPDATIAAAQATSDVTHGDPATGWGTALYHLMIQAALVGEDPLATLPEDISRLPDEQALYREMLDPNWNPRETDLNNGTVWTCLAQAVWAVRHADTFEDALTAALNLGGDTDTVGAVTGGLAGAKYGIQSIPSRWTTYLHGYVGTAAGRATYRLSDLQHLALRLIGATRGEEQPLGPRRGPSEISPSLFAADLGAAGDVPRDWAVVSLCRTGEQFAQHPIRRELYMIDGDGDRNLDLAAAVQDATATIDAFLAEGRQTVVHCHGGASRTGLVLRAWLMRQKGWDEPTATACLTERWPDIGLWTEDFTEFLRSSWP
jgi:ADP-ribosyl-[dinitrogen reductase] hydrolase